MSEKLGAAQAIGSRDADASGPRFDAARNAPDLDVVIPVFNCVSTVEAAIASIQAQTVHNIRIVVVDDGSTDGTLDVIRGLAGRDPRIVVIRKPNSGIVDALNIGLAQCSAHYIARHDGDDLAYPQRFERQLEYLRSHADCCAVGAYARLIDDSGRPTGAYSRAEQPELANPRAVPAQEPYLLHPFLMARRDAIAAIGGYRHNLLAEDSDLYWRLQEHGRLFNLPEVLGDYRVHAHSTTSSSIARGRINALFSELAALSARRRRGGRPDLSFTAALVAEVQQSVGLQQVYLIGARLVDETERRWLRIAMAAKLIDLSFIRGYHPDPDDCRFIRGAFDDGWTELDAVGRSESAERLTQLAKSLLERGQFGAALIATPTRLYPRLATRLAFRWLLPLRLRRGLRERLGWMR